MSVSLSAERDRIQRQVEELEQSLSATHAELELLSSDTDDESDGDDTDEEGRQSAAGLLAQREKIQKEIQNLENVLGPDSPIYVSDDDDDSSSEESELGLTPSADSCLQMNLVYQQVIQETLDQLETLLIHNQRQQMELVTQLSGPIKESSREQPAPSSCQHPSRMHLGRFLKPYFKDKLTGLGPPANQETKEKASRMTGCLDDNKLKIKRWEGWQKTLLIHSVARDSLRRLVQPKLSKVDYLSQKLSSAAETDREQLRQQIDSLEREIDLLRGKKEEELIGNRYDDHDWPRISNIDFEGTRDAEDIRRFWHNFLHPSINKTQWSKEEVQQLKEVSRRHGERHWETIAADLGTGRTAFLCLQTFQRFVSDSLKRSSWTPAEDAQLRELVDKMRIGNFIPYTQMTYFMEGRDPCQLIYRWNHVLDPSLKKGLWTKEEDQLLLQAVARHGEKNWCKIRFEVPGRSDGSCRDRYCDYLKAGIKRGAFDKKERELLLQLVEKHGVGRWAKIAAEIPHRLDGQCLREWKKLSKPPDQITSKKPSRRRREVKKEEKKKSTGRIRRRLKKESSEEESSSEEETVVVEYMDTDEEEEKKKKKKEEEVKIIEEVEEEEELYTFPPLQEWIPAEKAEFFTFLSFRPVELPASGVAHSEVHVRSTIQGKFGRSVIIGPRPKVLQWVGRYSSSTMMMVTPPQLRAHLHRQAYTFSRQKAGRKGAVQPSRPHPLTDKALTYELQAAVTPWIGNLIIPPKHKLTAADTLRERGEKTPLPSTPVFLLLLQTMNVDAMGCKDLIEQRRNRVMSLERPPRHPPARPNTVAGILQQREVVREESQFDQQHKLILKQLQQLEQQKQQKQLKQRLVRLQQPPPLPLLRPPLLPPQRLPAVLPQMPPNVRPQAVFIPHPPKIQLMNAPPPAAAVITSTLPPPPVSVVPKPLNASSPCPTSAPSTENLKVPATLDAKPPSQNAAPSPSPSRRRSTKGRRKKKVAKIQEAVSSSQSEAGGACTGGDGVVKEGGRTRKPTQKAKALQEASKAKAEAKKKAASSRRKNANIKTALPVLQTPPSSTQNLSLAPPSSIPTNQHPAPSTLPAPYHNDHDYTCFSLVPTPREHDLKSIKPTPDSTPNKPPKAPPTRRKRERVEEPLPSVTSSQDEQCVDGTAVIQEGKRIRTPTQKARALQEACQAKAEAKTKRTSSSSPLKKRSRESRPEQEVVIENLPVTRPPGFCLLPGQSIWVMTPHGLVPLTGAPPQSLPLPLVPGPALQAPPGNISNLRQATPPLGLTTGSLRPSAPRPPTAVLVPVNLPALNQPRPLPAPPTTASKPVPPAFIRQPVSNPTSCPAKRLLPYKGAVKAGLTVLPPLRREALQFDPALMFLESREVVCDWLSGRGGVMVPGAGVALPYLPPFVSSLSTLCELLRAKKALTRSSLQLLGQKSEPRRPPTKPDPTRPDQTRPDTDSSAERSRSPDLLDQPDSTSDLRPAQDTAAPSVSADLLQEEEEEKKKEAELVAVTRRLVAERFSSNPAYQLLKARFLSCFTVPALMATMQPISERAVEEEEELEEEEEEKTVRKIQERGRQRKAQRSLLLCDGPGAPASHFSGINSGTPVPEQTVTVQ